MGTPGQAAPQQVRRQGRMLHQTKPCCRACCDDAPEAAPDHVGCFECRAITVWHGNSVWKAAISLPGQAMPLCWGEIPEGCRQAERSVSYWDALCTHKTDCCGGAMLGCKASTTQAPYECKALHKTHAHAFQHVQPHWLCMSSGGALSEGHSVSSCYTSASEELSVVLAAYGVQPTSGQRQPSCTALQQAQILQPLAPACMSKLAGRCP